jgi:hypothetical protein
VQQGAGGVVEWVGLVEEKKGGKRGGGKERERNREGRKRGRITDWRQAREDASRKDQETTFFFFLFSPFLFFFFSFFFFFFLTLASGDLAVCLREEEGTIYRGLSGLAADCGQQKKGFLLFICTGRMLFVYYWNDFEK